MTNANPKTRRILRAVNWTTLVISTAAAGRMIWVICRNGTDAGSILLLGTFLVTGTSSVLQLINLRKQDRRETEEKQ